MKEYRRTRLRRWAVRRGPGTQRLAWLVLRAANRTQAKGSTARLIVPRDPELADELGRELGSAPADEDLLTAEEFLEERGYLAPADIGLTRGTYTITPVGLRWIEGEPPPRAPGTPQTAAKRPERTKPRSSAGNGQEGAGRPWWRRLFGG